MWKPAAVMRAADSAVPVAAFPYSGSHWLPVVHMAPLLGTDCQWSLEDFGYGSGWGVGGAG
jgi:hypothetical protein